MRELDAHGKESYGIIRYAAGSLLGGGFVNLPTHLHTSSNKVGANERLT